MFGKIQKEEKVKTFVEGTEVSGQPSNAPTPQPTQPLPQQAVPPEPTTRYVEANLQLTKLPATLLLKIEVYGDTIPVVLKIDEFGNVKGE